MINETTVLILCFIVTFGFLGYKLSGFIKKILDNYRNKIKDAINESEQLKMQAIALLDDANKKDKYLADEVLKMNQNAEEKMNQIENNFNQKLKEMTEKIINENKQKIESNKQNMIEEIKDKIKNEILKIMLEYTNNLPEHDKNKAFSEIISKINFKNLIDNN